METSVEECAGKSQDMQTGVLTTDMYAARVVEIRDLVVCPTSLLKSLRQRRTMSKDQRPPTLVELIV